MATQTKDGMQVLKESFNEAESSLDVFVQGGSVSTTPPDGATVISTHVIDFSSIPNSATAPFEITASLGSTVKNILFFDTTGETLQIRTGASTGTLLIYTAPGQDSGMPVAIASGTRVSIRSNGSAPTAGNVIITFLA